MRVALAQINPTVGDFEGNTALLGKFYKKASEAGADVAVFPELVLTGYPPEDLLLRREFVDRAMYFAERVVEEHVVSGTVAIFGTPFIEQGNVYNSAVIASDRRRNGVYHKMCLPNYGVFDEKRYFKPGKESILLKIAGVPVAVNICEDSWDAEGPYNAQCLAGAQIVLNLSASPYHRGKSGERHKVMARISREYGVPFCYTTLAGGQDELVFDGGSFVLGRDGHAMASLPQFEEGLLVVDLDVERAGGWFRDRGKKLREITVGGVMNATKPAIPTPTIALALVDEDEVLGAVICGTRDYLHKNGFTKALVGVSGGIDSALIAAIGTMALGKENMTGVVMPGPFSAEETQSDAERVCRNLGIKCLRIPITDSFEIAKKMLTPALGVWPGGLTEENLQSRLRGLTLMTLSNATSALVLVTGNKSEAATGYCTMYGDTVGGFAPIKDVPKTLVWRIARRINEKAGQELIPVSVIDRVPTAELKPNQKDSDTLPEYALLDKILAAFIEQGKSIPEMMKAGLPEGEVLRTLDFIDKSEFKRRQYPPGVKITPRAFGRDWRLPLTNRYRSSRK